MSLKLARERYQVPFAGELDLTAHDSSDKSLFPEGKSAYQEHFDQQRLQLQDLQKTLYAQDKHRILFVIQAMDTGGKDGCIKHVFSYINPAGIDVVSFKKPSARELAHDFLWRVHRHVPSNGMMTVFNRSHYEDILAVRVKKLFADQVWQRREQMIIDFERMLADEGTTIIKIFLNISKEEQKSRLQARLDNPEKHWKFNPDDLKDRSRWDEFQLAYQDILAATSRAQAPWYIIPANRKWYRNLVVAQILIDTLKQLDMRFPKAQWHPESFKIDE